MFLSCINKFRSGPTFASYFIGLSLIYFFTSILGIENSITGTAESKPGDLLANSATKVQTKCVILRLKVDQFSEGDPSEYNDAIKTYLAFAGRPTMEWEEERHYAHIEPFQDPELRQTRFHNTLDMEQDSIENPEVGKLSREVHRVHRDGRGKMYAHCSFIF